MSKLDCLKDKKAIIAGFMLVVIALSFKCVQLNKQINDLKLHQSKETQICIDELNTYKNLRMRVSAYTASINECDSTPDKTAIMRKPIPGGTAAVSVDRMYMLGKKVYIEGIGVYVVNDLMNERFTDSIDIVVGTKREATLFGIQDKNVVIL